MFFSMTSCFSVNVEIRINVVELASLRNGLNNRKTIASTLRIS